MRILWHIQQWRRNGQPRQIVLVTPLACRQVQNVPKDFKGTLDGCQANLVDLEAMLSECYEFWRVVVNRDQIKRPKPWLN